MGFNDIKAKKGIVRLAYKGKVRYGLWEKGEVRLYAGSPLAGGKLTRGKAKLEQARLLAPCRPSKIVAIGLNYKMHAKEVKKKPPQEPMIFLKPSSSVIGPGEAIRLPAISRRVDYEAELAVVMGRRCYQVPAGQALDYVLGYSCLNDVTARDLQARDVQYSRAKGFDTFCPIGPVIALDLNPSRVAVRSYVNNRKKQDGNTNDLIFDVPSLIEFVSQCMTLRPGDVIATGTPAGIGPLAAGDSVTIAVQGIGKLVNPVIA